MPINSKTAPVLSFDTEKNRWVLRLAGEDDIGRSYFMRIRYAHNGRRPYDPNTTNTIGMRGPGEDEWSAYRFYAMDEGEEVELVTRAEMNERLDAIEEHEGKEAAEKWYSEQTEWEVVRDDHPVFALREHWRAMMILGIFQPSITL